MNKYSARILGLRDELLDSIKTIMRNNDLDEVPLNDCSDKTLVPWWSNKGYIYEGQVLAVKLADRQLCLVVDAPDFMEDVLLYEDSFALENPIWLNGIRGNIIEILMEKHERVCYECGKPMYEGYCIRGGGEYYCSDRCLFENYSSDQWDKMNEDNTSNSYLIQRDE